MKIHQQAQCRFAPGVKPPTFPETALIEDKPAPTGDTIFLSSRTVALPDPKGQGNHKVVSREVVLKNGTHLTHNIDKKTVTVSEPEKPKVEFYNTSMQLPSDDGKPLVIQNQEMEQRLFGNGGMILLDHANHAHHLDDEGPSKHRGFRTDEYHVFESGAAVGKQYTSNGHSNHRFPKHVRAWQTHDGNIQVPNNEGMRNWNVLCPFVTQSHESQESSPH